MDYKYIWGVIISPGEDMPISPSDLSGLARRVNALTRIGLGSSTSIVSKFFLEYTQMWHDVGKADPTELAREFHGRKTLYLDRAHNQLNPDLKVEDYLHTAKEFIRRLARRENRGSDEENWYAAQDKLAQILVTRYLDSSLSTPMKLL
jgi:hypothetical protein